MIRWTTWFEEKCLARGIIPSTVIFVVILSFQGVLFAATVTIPVMPGEPGQNVVLPIDLNLGSTEAAVSGFNFEIEFPSELQFMSSSTGDLTSSNWMVNDDAAADGVLSVVGFGFADILPPATGSIAEITFQVDANATGSFFPVTFDSSISYLNEIGTPPPENFFNGGVLVPEPSALILIFVGTALALCWAVPHRRHRK